MAEEERKRKEVNALVRLGANPDGDRREGKRLRLRPMSMGCIGLGEVRISTEPPVDILAERTPQSAAVSAWPTVRWFHIIRSLGFEVPRQPDEIE